MSMSVYTPAQSDGRLFVAEMDANGVLTPVYQLAGDDPMTATVYTPAKSDGFLFAAALDAQGVITPLIKVEGLPEPESLAPKMLFGIFATGGGALTAQNIVTNTFGVDPTISKNASGKYDITFPSAVLETNRTFVFGGGFHDNAGGQWSSHVVTLSTTVVRFITAGITGSIGDITLTNIPVGILVWPA